VRRGYEDSEIGAGVGGISQDDRMLNNTDHLLLNWTSLPYPISLENSTPVIFPFDMIVSMWHGPDDLTYLVRLLGVAGRIKIIHNTDRNSTHLIIHVSRNPSYWGRLSLLVPTRLESWNFSASNLTPPASTFLWLGPSSGVQSTWFYDSIIWGIVWETFSQCPRFARIYNRSLHYIQKKPNF